MDVGIRYGDGRWPDLKSTFLLRDAFFPVCSLALLEGMHPLRGLEDLKHHTLIHDRSMASESAFPTWRTWLQAASFLQINDSAAAYQTAINGSGIALGRTTLEWCEGRSRSPNRLRPAVGQGSQDRGSLP
jgi:LysR family transcriptional regulator, glycine cleavage system transcriptional activator